MTIARVTAHDGVGGSSATFGGTPTSGNLLLASVYDIAGVTISGWTVIVAAADSAGNRLTLLAKVSAGNEGTITPTGTFVTATSVCEFSGTANPFSQDGTAASATTSGNVTSKASAALTTTDAGSLVFLAGLMGANTGSSAWSGGPTLILNDAVGGVRSVCGQYLPGTTVSAFTSTLSWTTSTDAVVLIAGFKPVAASGPANLKAVDGLAKASIKTINGLAIASVKTRDGLA